ncbi:MAG: divergent PAP2 family protein [Clostridia bacterium]|nr:divergent PAP2 family protein [Clostridia bacterium]
MELFKELWGNRILMAALAGWLVAQIAKAALYALINREFRLDRLVGSGGMPSSHAATVCALATAAFKQYGPGSFAFAISLILAAVVIYDARGVRLETGKQAVTIAAIIEHLIKEGEILDLPEFELKELVGHTAFQVFVGSLMGIGVGLWLG